MNGRGAWRGAGRLGSLPAYPLAGIPERIARLREVGHDVIDLGAGDAGLPVPEVAVEALREAAARPEMQKYSFQRGLPEYRAEVADWMMRRYGRRPDPTAEILPLIGSKEGLAHLCLAVLDPGDLALVPQPGYAAYAGATLLAGGRVAPVSLRRENGFLVPPEEIRDAPPGLRMVFLNYPNNPTTAVAEPSYLAEVLEAAAARGALLVYDNAYAEVAFDGFRPPSLLEVGPECGRWIEFHSFSKSFQMTGWRLGWACGSADVLAALARVKSYYDTGPYLAIQAAGAAVLRSAEASLEEIRRRLDERRRAAVVALQEVGIELPPPRATLYLWFPVPGGGSSAAFADRALEQEGLVVLPGAALGAAGEGYIRMSLSVEPGRYEEVARRLARAAM